MTRTFEIFLVVSLVVWNTNSLAAADENCRRFEVNDGRITIPITIGGSETRAMISSGLQTLGVSTALAEQLGLEVIEPEPVSSQRARYLPQLTQLTQLLRRFLETPLGTSQKILGNGVGQNCNGVMTFFG